MTQEAVARAGLLSAAGALLEKVRSQLKPAGMPESALTQDYTRNALDELFSLTSQYRSSDAYRALLNFTAQFRFCAPYNAMLIHVQRPGTTFAATASDWLRKYGRTIKPGSRPLVILQVMGPVSFVFDVSDTQPLDDAPPLPPEVLRPFEAIGTPPGNLLIRTLENTKRDGVVIYEQDAGSHLAGYIKASERPGYHVILNSNHTPTEQYATLAHELGHLYCGHVGTPHPDWWPDRRDGGQVQHEFEAESVAFIVCQRFGIETTSEKYLAEYQASNKDIPTISFNSVMRAAGLIEQMGRKKLPARKETTRGRV